HPLSLLVDRNVGEQNISLNDGQEEAEKYLKQHEFDDMVLFRSSQYDSVGVYSFLYEQDSVRIYPDTVDVKVGLDNDKIIRLIAKNYVINTKKRDIPEPNITKEEARSKVDPGVDIKEDFLSVIDNELGDEVLIYEFIGTLGDDTYRVFINAMNGT